MTVLSPPKKAKLGLKATKAVAGNPTLLRMAAPPAFKAAKPIAKRRARKRTEKVGEAARALGETLVTYGPTAARELGLIEEPKPRRTMPLVATGVAIGASVMFLLDHRRQVAKLVG